MTDLGESRLIEMARAGDQDAFGQLYQRSLSQIRAVGCVIFRGPGAESNLEDFCQDVWLRALRFFNGFREDCDFTTWIVWVARSRAKAILQRRGQLKNGDDRLLYQGPEMSDEQWESRCFATQDTRRDAAAAKLDVGRLVRVLSPQKRELVELYYLQGLSEREIADRQGIPLGTVRSRLARLMKALRDEVGPALGIDLGPFSV